MGFLEEVTVARIAEVEDCSKQWCLAWHHSGGVLASCGDDKVVRVWKCTSESPFLECRTKLDSSHSRAIRSVCFSHDGKFLASASFDSTIVIYEKGEDGEFEETNKLEGHESEVKGCTFSPSDEFFATCSRDKSVWFWQLDEEDDFAVSSILQPHTGDVKFVIWHPSEDLLVSCSYDFSIRFFKFDGEDWVTHQHIADAHDGTVWGAAFDGNGRRMVTVGEDRVIQLWTCTATPEEGGVRNGKWQKAAKCTVEGTRWPLYSVSWNSMSGLIAVGGGDETVRVFRVEGTEGEETIQEVAMYSGHEGDVNCVSWHPKDATLLASASDDGSIRLLRLQLSKLGNPPTCDKNKDIAMNNSRASTSNESYGRGRWRGGRGGGGSRGMRESTRSQNRIPLMPYACPLDPDGHPVTVPMRFEVIKQDGANALDTEELKDFYQNALRMAARDEEVEVDDMGEMRITPVEGMAHSRWMSCNNWQKKLPLLACQFHHLVRHDREWTIISHEMPILYTHSQLIYPLRLNNMHQDVPFRRIKFGSFINNGCIGIHWNVEGGKKIEGDDEDGFTFYKDIDGSFEYDRRQITIFFQNREYHPDDKEKKYCMATYKITINLGSIRKIGLDQVTFKDGKPRRSLILHVDFAPKIQVKLRNVNGGNDRKGNGFTWGKQSFNGRNNQQSMHNGNSRNYEQQQSWSKFEHRLNIRRGRYPGEVSDRCALHESKILVLELDEDHLNEKLEQPGTINELMFDILTRLRHKTNKAVEFTSYNQVELIEGEIRIYRDGYYKLERVHPYDVHRDIDDHVLKMIKDAATELVVRPKEKTVANMFDKRHHIQLKVFRLRALLEGILQRGMNIRIQMLSNREYWYWFVKMICEKYAVYEQTTLAVLENLLSIISEGRPHCPVVRLFMKEWKDSRSANRTKVFTKEQEKKGFTRVMKFVQTPTRFLFVGYETIMANRVLNQHSRNGTEIVRVSFRDDSGEYMREMSCGSAIIRDTMRAVLMERGIHFAGRDFVWLGNSNSQLRDHGCYMYHETDTKKAREIRRKLGNFHKLTSIPKWLARQGQCFTQARESGSKLKKGDVGVTFDFIGGMTDKGKPFCFSDGVGTISHHLARKLSDEHSLPRVASAFQIRHKGQKGLVAVDPIIDDRNKLLEMMGKADEGKMVYVRPSMDKFEVDETSRGGAAEQGETSNLEIVKYSMASPLFLNRPLLNILSQVTEDQSAESHRRMSNRIEELLDIQLRNMTQSLYIERRARETIKEMSFPFAMEVFTDSNPLKITSEPFLKTMLRANAKFILHKQLNKMQIRIPPDYGRSMFGVVDTTGVLQYGQCFVQYSTSTSKHLGRSRTMRRDGAEGAIILTGPCMITKNPCIEKGDVRRFEAIDVSGLRHLVDVVVFPQHGHRPHPDEMAGSDLDGDEYSLIWDREMMFDYNEEASLFPSGEDVVNWPIVTLPNGEVDVEKCEERLAEFYIEAVTQEQVGVLSNAHLATSDFYGLDNKASRSLAKKIAQSLDFQKNGVPPEKMTTSYEKDPDDESRMIPPEKAVRKPDYMEKMRDAVYESRGIMGRIYREIKRYQNAIDWGEEQIDMIKMDPDFNLPGWQKYEGVVKREMELYCHGIRSLMEHYGIVSEGEIMSGQIVSIKNRISEKEADDMNLFNTNQIIEDKVKREIAAAREAFFKTLLNWETELDQVDNKRRDVDRESILCRIVRSNTTNMEAIRLKAAAAYNICYEAANRQIENGDQTSIILSFPWVFYDVLADIKLRPDSRIVRVLPDEKKEQSDEPLAMVMSEFIDDYCVHDANVESYNAFKRQFEENSLIRRSMEENEGLARASFVLVQWARHIGAMGINKSFNEHHLIALFIRFGLGDIMVRGTRRRYIQRPSGEIREHLRKGEHLLRFIDYLASREFRMGESLSFSDVLPGVLIRGEWRGFAEACIGAYLALATTHTFDLPMEEERDTGALRAAAVLKEYEPRKMELPEGVIKRELEEVRRHLQTVSGCVDIQLRPMGNTTEVFVSAIGSSENFKRLNALVISPAPPRSEADIKDMILPQLVYDRLLKAAREVPPSL